MPPFKSHLQLGGRWLRCGWRLFMRNPWLLGGMGVCAAALLLVVGAVPLLGGPLVGLIVPPLVASFYIAIDGVAKQKRPLPAALRMVALKQSPKELVNLARDEGRLMQVVIFGLCSLVVVVLADVIAWFIAGTAWANRSVDVPVAALPLVVLAGLVLLAFYLALAASLVYALPLALLQRQPLVPAVAASFQHSLRHPLALLVVLALLAVPLVLGGLTAFYGSVPAAFVRFAVATVALPVGVCGLYCSYRNLFATAAPHSAGVASVRAVPVDRGTRTHV